MRRNLEGQIRALLPQLFESKASTVNCFEALLRTLISGFAGLLRINSGLQTTSASRPLSLQQRRESGHSGTPHLCHTRK
jgi:hypothetical protein